MKIRSSLFRDQPEHPLQRAIWWIEWALRHPNCERIQSPSKWMSLWRSELYDVKLVIFIVIFLAAMYTKSLLTKGILKYATKPKDSDKKRN